jgi:hypothetical protein
VFVKHNRSLKVAVQGPALWPTLIHTYKCVCSELCSMLQHEVLSSCGGGVCVYLGAVVAALILLSYVC